MHGFFSVAGHTAWVFQLLRGNSPFRIKFTWLSYSIGNGAEVRRWPGKNPDDKKPKHPVQSTRRQKEIISVQGKEMALAWAWQIPGHWIDWNHHDHPWSIMIMAQDRSVCEWVWFALELAVAVCPKPMSRFSFPSHTHTDYSINEAATESETESQWNEWLVLVVVK